MLLNRFSMERTQEICFLGEAEYRKTRFPVEVKNFNVDDLPQDQLNQIKANSKRCFKWMQDFVKGSGLDECGIILRFPDKSQLYMEITPQAVAFTPNLYKYTISDMADDHTLGLVVLNWPVIKEKVKSACEWLIRNKKENETEPDSVSSRLSAFAL